MINWKKKNLSLGAQIARAKHKIVISLKTMQKYAIKIDLSITLNKYQLKFTIILSSLKFKYYEET